MIRILSLLVIATSGWISCSPAREDDTALVGVSLYSFNRFPFEEALEKAKQAGAHYVEGFSFHKVGGTFGDKSLSTLSESELMAIRSLLQDSGLKMVSMYASAETLAEWQVLFEVADQLDLQFLVGEPKPDLWDPLEDLAERYGIRVAIHQHAEGMSHFWHPDSVLKALEGRSNFVACGDLGHWVRSGLDPVECLKKLEGNLVSIHAKDLDTFGDLEANDVKMGAGVIDYPGVMAELERQRFDGFVFVECEHDWEDNLDDVRSGVSMITNRGPY